MRALRTTALLVLAGLAAGCGGGGGATDTLRDIAYGVGGHMLGVEHGVLFYAFDTLAYPEKPVDLAARLQSGKDLDGLKGATIGFYRDDELIGQAETDGDGHARFSWTPPKAGDYEFTAKVIKPPRDEDYADAVKVSPAPVLVMARSKDADFAVVDLDHTVVGSGFWRVLLGGAAPMPEATRVTHRLAERYNLIYLTHRPNILARKSKDWLGENDFPRGVLLVSELKDAFGDSGRFKSARLKEIRKSFPNIRVGIGDKISDAQVYVEQGLTAYLIPRYKEKPKDMLETAGQINGIRGGGRLHVVSDWNQIEQGVFAGKSYPAQTFVRRLRDDARRLQVIEDQRKKKDDDDDD